MKPPDTTRAAAAAAFAAMEHHKLPPTPRNFEVWYCYHTREKPRLCDRIDRLTERAEPFTPEVMASLYDDFFAMPTEFGVVTGKMRELRSVAIELVDRLSTNKGMIRDYGLVLDSAASVLETVSSVQGAKRAIDTLRSATASASARVQALEHLFAASVVRINELHEELARSEKDASCDPLTGLANRRAFEAALIRDAAQAANDGSALTLLLLDIDHFKKFNDVHGHIMGDKLLRLVAQLLTRQVKGRDTAARYGGEEFAVILMQADLPAALIVAEQIRVMLSKAPLLNRATAQTLGIVTCSIGVAEYRVGEDLTALIDRADRALYEAKRTGRNRVVSEHDVIQPAGAGGHADFDVPVIDSTVH